MSDAETSAVYAQEIMRLEKELAALHQDAASKWAFLEWRDRAENAEAELTALRKDAERLDWLEAGHDCSDITGHKYKGMGIELVERGSDGWHFAGDYKPENSTDHDTLREIIDAATEKGKNNGNV